MTAPDVDNQFTVDIHGDRRAQLLTAFDFFGQRVGDLLEPGIAVALHDIVHVAHHGH
jgi:hypothetical protein